MEDELLAAPSGGGEGQAQARAWDSTLARGPRRLWGATGGRELQRPLNGMYQGPKPEGLF